VAIDERELDDASLVTAAQAGDQEAFAELFRRHYPAVRRACARRFSNGCEAEEIAQAAFVRAFERIDRCGGERRFGAWVQVIALRLGIDARRRLARTVPTDEPMAPGRVSAYSPCEEHVLRQEHTAQVHALLDTLPARQRQVIIARDLEGRRPGEIAASLGVSVGAVDSLLLRARRRVASTWRAGAIEHGAAGPVAATPVAVTGAAAARAHALRSLSDVRDALSGMAYRAASAMGMAPAVQRVGGVAVAVLAAGSVLSTAPPPAAPSPVPVAVQPRISPTVLPPVLPRLVRPVVVQVPVVVHSPVTVQASAPPVTAPRLPAAPVQPPLQPAGPGLGPTVGGVVAGVDATVSRTVATVAATVSALTGPLTGGGH